MPFIQKLADKLNPGNKKPQDQRQAETESSKPDARAFDHNQVVVIFVLGGPGAGKGTQSDRLVKDYNFVHLSAGDLLRAEQHREGSQYGELIRQHIREGTIVPMEVTVKLLENAMREKLGSDGKGRFLIDGFPRQMDQALKFEEDVCLSKLTLFYTCTEEIMLQRLLERGKTSGREDDNEESIKKRFQTYQHTTMPVIEHYEKIGKVSKIDGTKSVDEVYAESRGAVDKIL